MKITKRQLRRIIKEEKTHLYESPEPHAWAKAMYGTPDRDEEGQTIIYLSKDDHPTSSSFEGELPQEWDWDETYDGLQWIVYTGQSAGTRPDPIQHGDPRVSPEEFWSAHGRTESKKITRAHLQKIIKEEKARIIQEMNPDGTISDNEDNERAIFMNDIEEQAEELVRFIQMESERIGGDFRGPGIRKEAYRLLAEIIHGLR